MVQYSNFDRAMGARNHSKNEASVKRLKRITIIILFVFCANFSFAQEAGRWRAGLEIGMLRPNNNGFGNEAGVGFLGAIELKYNLRNNMNVGLKAESMYFQNNKSDDGRLQSFSVTYDYYYSTRSQFSPFIGAGLGYYFCNAQYFVNDVRYNNPTCLFRTGFEFRRFRTSLTYNLVRTSETIFSNKNKDYISLTVGYYFGGGKRKPNE
jgi:opacity protein-like surface antigen